MNTLKNKKYLGIAGAAMIFFSIFFPFISVKVAGYSIGKMPAFIKSWGGWVLLLMSVASVMIMFRKELEEKIPQIYKTSFGAKVQSWGEKGLFVPTGITALILFFVIVNKRFFYKVTIPFFGGEINVNKYGSVSTGFWFAVIGLALLVAHAIIYEGDKNTQATQQMPQQPVQPQVAPTTDSFTQNTYQQPVEQPVQTEAPVDNNNVNNNQF